MSLTATRLHPFTAQVIRDWGTLNIGLTNEESLMVQTICLERHYEQDGVDNLGIVRL